MVDISRDNFTDEQWAVIAPLGLKRSTRRGRPRTRPEALIADKGGTIQLSRHAVQTGNLTQRSDG